MFKQLYNDLMSVTVTRWGIYAFIMFIVTRLVNGIFQSPFVDTAIQIAYALFFIAFLWVAWNEHVKESRAEEKLKAQKSKDTL